MYGVVAKYALCVAPLPAETLGVAGSVIYLGVIRG